MYRRAKIIFFSHYEKFMHLIMYILRHYEVYLSISLRFFNQHIIG